MDAHGCQLGVRGEGDGWGSALGPKRGGGIWQGIKFGAFGWPEIRNIDLRVGGGRGGRGWVD